jgi:hypothetical protein
MARKRPVRIREIDAHGTPWFCCKFRMRNGRFGWHFLAVMDSDRNWEPVKRHHLRPGQS